MIDVRADSTTMMNAPQAISAGLDSILISLASRSDACFWISMASMAPMVNAVVVSSNDSVRLRRVNDALSDPRRALVAISLVLNLAKATVREI